MKKHISSADALFDLPTLYDLGQLQKRAGIQAIQGHAGIIASYYLHMWRVVRIEKFADRWRVGKKFPAARLSRYLLAIRDERVVGRVLLCLSVFFARSTEQQFRRCCHVGVQKCRPFYVRSVEPVVKVDGHRSQSVGWIEVVRAICLFFLFKSLTIHLSICVSPLDSVCPYKDGKIGKQWPRWTTASCQGQRLVSDSDVIIATRSGQIRPIT
ncbi:hypothetical protein T12_1317 [Trichinella patagoniensis]|uniref:Uncharacterized protein n=1 Tax=Trichinella patagoniensis TaxID=990121 RepID=A0A0V1ABV5_9BILA|nr:hypothetical protein T12_1317 [Trichinella patagoniensis]